jgi:hypothetical protein
MLSVYTRHHPDCKNAGAKSWRRCNCPKWIWGSVNGNFIDQVSLLLGHASVKIAEKATRPS